MPAPDPTRLPIGSSGWRQLLSEGATAFGFSLGDDQLALFQIYAEELLAWNQRINLTAITDPAEIAVKHFIDSLAGAADLLPGCRVIDLGSGGGFPGIPLRIVRPDLKMTLVDSVRKKNSFQKQLCRQLELNDVRAVHSRIEDLANAKAHKGQYDAVVSRALTDLTALYRLAAPLLGVQGLIIAYRGRTDGSMQSPSSVSGSSGWQLTHRPYRLPNTTAQRTITCAFKPPA